MNLLAFGFLLISCHAWASEINDNFLVAGTFVAKSKIKDAIENFRPTIRNGDKSLGLPPLDPFTADQLPINFNEMGKINFEALLTDLRVDGLSSYKVNNADFKVFGLKFNMDLSFPLVVATTNYSMKGKAADFEIYGTGEMDAAAHDFRFQIEISFALKNQHIQIKSMSTKVSLRALDFHATGLNNDQETSETMSKTISKMVPKLIDTNQRLIVDNINKILKETINKYLSTITFKDLKKMLGL